MNILLEVPTIELMRLWAELVECYHGKNGFGSDTAEIYAYRFQQYSPFAHDHSANTPTRREELRKLERKAAMCLVELVDLFCQEYKCKATIDGDRSDIWLQETMDNRPYDHRAHVRIIRS